MRSIGIKVPNAQSRPHQETRKIIEVITETENNKRDSGGR